MNFLLTILTNLVSVLGGGLMSAFGYLTDVMKQGADAAMKFHQEGISAARDLGLGAKQAQAYTQALTKNTIELANKYGVTADAIKEIQRGISDATGRQLILNETQTEGFLQLNKLVGSQTVNAFSSEIMNKLGGQITTVQGAVSKAYATAAKQGLNASKFSGEVAKNLSMANKLSFRDGINGIIRMTALSQKLGFNLQSIESAANKFLEFDSAIESSAQLQMLGGAAGVYGSNPLTMMYEANYDPESFTQRMTDILKGLGTFDAKTGMSKVNGMNMDRARGIAQAMGISADEAVTIAKKQAEVRFKESRFSTDLNARFGNDEEKKNYILNNSTYNTQTQQLELNGKALSALTDADLSNIMQFDGMSDHELMAQQAQALTSLPEKIDGAASQVTAGFADGLAKFIPNLIDVVGDIGNTLTVYSKQWGESVGNALVDITRWLTEHGSEIKSIAKTVLDISTWVLGFATNHWDMTLAAIAAWKLGLKDLVGGAATKVGGQFSTGSLQMWHGNKLSYRTNRAAGDNWFKAAMKSPFQTFGRMSTGAKVMTAGAGLVSTGLAVAQGIGAQSAYKDKLQAIEADNTMSQQEKAQAMDEARVERNSDMGGAIGGGVGGAIGLALGGPVGAAIGNVVGQFIGGFIGEHWDDITGAFSAVGDFIAEGWGKFTNWLSDAWTKVTDFAISSLKYMWNTISGGVVDAWNWAVGGIQKIGSAIGDWWTNTGSKIFSGILDFFFPIRIVIRNWDEITNWLGEAWHTVVDGVTNAWNTYVTEPLGAVGAYIQERWNEGVGFIRNTWNTVVGGFRNAVSSIGNWWNKSGSRIFSGILDFFFPIRIVIRNWDEITNWFGEAWRTTVDGIAEAWNTYVTEPLGAVGAYIQEGWNTIVDAWNNFSFADTLSSIGNFLQGVWNEYIVAPWNKHVVEPALNAWNTIQDAWDRYVTQPAQNLWKHIRAVWDDVMGGLRRLWDDPMGTIGDAAKSAWDGLTSLVGYSEGGIVGGNSYEGDKAVARVNSGEMILNMDQQAELFNFINSAMSSITKTDTDGNATYFKAAANPSVVVVNGTIPTNISNNTIDASKDYSVDSMVTSMVSNLFNDSSNIITTALNPFGDVKTKPFGEDSFKSIPKDRVASDGKVNVAVNDININISGTIKLDGGRNSANLDIRQLLSDTSFINSLKDMIKESINTDLNGGRFMNDDSSRRGYFVSSSTVGRT